MEKTNFLIHNISGDRFSGNNPINTKTMMDLLKRSIDKYSVYLDQFQKFDQHYFKKFVFNNPIPIWVAERSIENVGPITLWRSTKLEDKEVGSTQFEISRFYHRKNEDRKKIKIGRCNFKNQIVFYGAESGLVSYAETIETFTTSKEVEMWVGLAKWMVNRNLTLAVIGNLDKMANHGELRHIRDSFLSQEMDDDLKEQFLIWLEVLGNIFAIEDKRVYRLTSMISNFFYSNQIVDGLIYPSVKFSRLLRENSTEYQPGFNFSINPDRLKMSVDTSLELCSIYNFHKVDLNTVKTDIVDRHKEIDKVKGIVIF